MTPRKLLSTRWSILIFLAAAVLVTGCEETHPNTRVVFQNATINGRPARLVFDTGAPVLTIFDYEAKDANLRMALRAPPKQSFSETMSLALSEPAQISLANFTFTGQMMVGYPPRGAIIITGDGKRFDGLVGWGELKDNILIFDGAQHRVTSVTELPAGLETWQQFKIGPDWHLTLKTPMPNGQTGTILIDTGMFAGVALPPKQFADYRVAHPNAPTGFLIYMSPGSGEQRVDEVWADEISLGGLTLYDVPIHPADASEMRIDAKNYVGTIQLFGLARMDFVVDGKHGVAYVRPKNPPGPYYPAVSRPGVARDPTAVPIEQDWVIDGKLTLNPERLRYSAGGVLALDAIKKFQDGDIQGALDGLALAIGYDAKNDLAYYCRALIRQRQNDAPGALADFNQALELNPRNEAAHMDRAVIEYTSGEIGSAETDYNQAVALDPRNVQAFYFRGVIRQMQGNLSGAIADFEMCMTLQPEAEKPQLYRELLRRWAGSPPQDLSTISANWKDDLSRGVAKYLSGSLSESALFALAATGTDIPARQSAAYYFAGFVRFLNQDLAGARDFWQKCQAADSKVTEAQLAAAGVAYLDSLPKK